MPAGSNDDTYIVTKLKPNKNNGVCGFTEKFVSTIPNAESKHDYNLDFKSLAACFARGRIRVLILFTAGANTENPNIRGQAQLAFDQLQQVITNTGISAQSMRVELAGILATTLTETTNANNDVTNFNNNLGTIRTANNADIVMVLTRNAYPLIAGNAVTSTINPALFTAIVSQGDAVNAKTFAHEFGHLAGARHEGDNTAINFEKGYVFATGTWPFLTRRGTVMATREGITMRDIDAGARRITQYSNPDKSYKSTSTGTGGNNNFLWFQQNGPRVAAFVPNPDDRLSIQIVPPYSTCPCRSPLLTSEVTCPTGNVRYRWEVSTNFTNFTTASTSSSLSLNDLPCSQSSFRGIRLTVTDDIRSVSATYYGNFDPNDCDNGFPQFKSNSEDAFTSVEDDYHEYSTVSPNPVSIRQGGNIKVSINGMSTSLSKEELRVEIVNFSRVRSTNISNFSVELEGDQIFINLASDAMTAGLNTILVRNVANGESTSVKVIAFD